MRIRKMTPDDWPSVSAIYAEGIATGFATFEKEVPSYEEWDKDHLNIARIVVEHDGNILGWAALSPVSGRCVYGGVGEVSVYVSENARNRGVGKLLMKELIEQSETEGFWTLQSGIFPENIGSIKLHEQVGFRKIGHRERIGSLDGVWKDNLIFERRSKMVGTDKNQNLMKNILVLCTGNSCRSQMAHGYLQHLLKDKANIYSAGIETHGLNPGAVSIMKEDGIDITGHTSNNVDEYEGIQWDYIITVCDHAKENCPFIPAPKATRIHRNFFDPSKVEGSETEKHAAFEKARNSIREFSENFARDNF